ncbi:MAG: homoserine O-succinyltransferase [Peptococcaceae bacterium]|nr:homoserine O-succinyltransferase [Peptococcaceae bacterium]MDR2736758.1 homoserine O-succinyltransferase [Gracilibacteraceae bacterium]
MPVKIPDTLPASKILAEENIFIMTEDRALHQDIRPLRIAILNLMPTKVVTETQLLRLIGNTPLQIDPVFLCTATYRPTHFLDHLQTFYRTFDTIRDQRFDGLIITGAPVELMDFEEVHYWDELTEILDWAQTNIFSTFLICWAAQVGLYHYYGVPKHKLTKKKFGVFPHRVLDRTNMLVRGFDDVFFAPHSRYTDVKAEDIEDCPDLKILCDSPEAGVYIVVSKDARRVFVTGHSEYDADTLAVEYWRDVQRGVPVEIPENYFIDDNPHQEPRVSWRGHAHLLFSNWLNYVYQETPYDLYT